MENLDILEKLGKVAGIAGIAVGAIVLIFGGIIQKNIFPGMTKEQGFRVIRMMIIAASVLAVMGIGAWVYTEFQKNKKQQEATLIQKTIVGTVQSREGVGIPSVKVSIARMPGVFDRSDSDGKFVVRIDGSGKKYHDAVFEHGEYDIIRKKVTVDFEIDDEEIDMGTIVMVSSYPPEESLKPENPNTTNNGAVDNGTTPSNHTNQSESTDITVFYDDEAQGCNLDITISIGNYDFVPQVNPVILTRVKTGMQFYELYGTAFCGGGQCSIWGDGQINVVPGGMYYIVFDAYGTCKATLLSETTYNELKATLNR